MRTNRGARLAALFMASIFPAVTVLAAEPALVTPNNSLCLSPALRINKHDLGTIISAVTTNNREDFFFQSAQTESSPGLWAQRKKVQNVVSFLAKQDPLPSEVDVLVVFGNEDLQTPLQAARVYKEKKPRLVVFAGGVGHSTKALRALARKHLGIRAGEVDSLSEAEIFALVFKAQLMREGVSEQELDAVILLDTTSRHSQENAVNALHLLDGEKVFADRVRLVLMQKPLLQRRAEANMRTEIERFEKKFQRKLAVAVTGYAPYVPQVAAMSEAEIKAITIMAVDEMEKLDVFAAPRFNYINPVPVPADVRADNDAIRKVLHPDLFIESGGKTVASKITTQAATRTDISRPIQVEAGWFSAGSLFAGIADQRYQAVIALTAGSAVIRFKDGAADIRLQTGDIATIFVPADVEFTDDSAFYVFRQTDALAQTLATGELVAGEEGSGRQRLVMKDGETVGEVFRDAAGHIQATLARGTMVSPERMVMITPKSAAIGIGIKTAEGTEAAHRHELDGRSRMEAMLCRSGSFTARVAARDAQDVRTVPVRGGELMVMYPDSVHGFEFNRASMAVVIQEPGRAPDKINVDLAPHGAAEKAVAFPTSGIGQIERAI